MPLQATSGVATYDAFGGGVPVAANYIEDVFSTWLYTGNGSTQTISNGIDLAGKGGMVWGKTRDAVVSHTITDTVRGVDKEIFPNTTDAQQTRATGTGSVFAFNSNGFSTSGVNGFINYSGLLEASWTFREQPKFFDVVTWTGNSVSGRTVAHNLGSAPGCVIIKSISDPFDWYVYHQSLGAGNFLNLNLTAAATASEAMFGPGNPAPSSTVITLGNSNATNGNGKTYIAYLFAHNAGGFGLTGTDNVISCGSYVETTGANAVNLGYEPQFLLLKNASSTSDWWLVDTMRGMTADGTDALLRANTTDAELSAGGNWYPTATGFANDSASGSGNTWIYIAIRRGPMKTPTTGTSVFDAEFEGNVPDGQKPFTRSSTGVVDMAFRSYRPGGVWNGSQVWSRLQDSNYFNGTASNAAETSGTAGSFAYNNGWFNSAATSTITAQVDWMFRRAPGFFDEVCYTGTGATNARTHNLTVAPELIIVKSRSAVDDWAAMTLFGTSTFGNGYLNTTLALSSRSYASNAELTTQPTATTFTLGTGGPNASGSTYVAYLFASCPGVSKVGSYTGTGTTQTINCGFTAGSRFVMIKRTDSTGDWYVWDSARGIVAGNDPYLLLNSTAAEVTSTDFVDTAATGFELSSTAPAALNASGGSYIFLAIA